MVYIMDHTTCHGTSHFTFTYVIYHNRCMWKSIITLTTIVNMHHNIELISTLKTLCILMWAHTIYQSTIISISCPRYKYDLFYWIENNMHLNIFQPRGRRWAHHMNMTSVTTVGHHYLARWCIM